MSAPPTSPNLIQMSPSAAPTSRKPRIIIGSMSDGGGKAGAAPLFTAAELGGSGGASGAGLDLYTIVALVAFVGTVVCTRDRATAPAPPHRVISPDATTGLLRDPSTLEPAPYLLR